MASVMPEGDAIRKAVKWISEFMQEKPDIHINELINRAVLKFDLSPKDTEFLMKFYKDKNKLEESK